MPLGHRLHQSLSDIQKDTVVLPIDPKDNPNPIPHPFSSQANSGEGTHHELLYMLYTILIQLPWLPGSHYNPSQMKSYILTTITAGMNVFLPFIKPKLYLDKCKKLTK